MPDLGRFRKTLLHRVGAFGFHLFDLAAYEFLYRLSPARKLMFFNGGYLPLAEDLLSDPAITEAEAPNAMMYHLVAQTLLPAPVAPRKVLDIGCGQGGGAYYLSRLFPSANVVATERNRTAVRNARKRFAHIRQLRFEPATGDRLVFGADRFDLVISVGAPTYFGLTRFVSEAAGVLAPGGTLAFSGGYREGDHALIEAELRAAAAAAGLEVRSYHDITPHTFAALKADIPRRIAMLARVPWPFRLYGEKWADLPGSAEYDEYATGKRADFAAVMTRS